MDAPPQMNSLEKIKALKTGLLTATPPDEDTARLSAMASAVIPMLEGMGALPDDPADLDNMLLTLGTWCFRARSDDAEVQFTVAEVLEGPPPPIVPIVCVETGENTFKVELAPPAEEVDGEVVEEPAA